MEENKNLKLRTTILEYALQIEDSVNTFLAISFEIDDKAKSKNFGNKAGISFKSKIDLLYDLSILSKEEHYNLEIFMSFRNKFLHDINCNSFKISLETIDSSIRNKLFKYLDEQTLEPSEEEIEKAYHNLFMYCLKALTSKYKARLDRIEEIHYLANSFISNYQNLSSLSLQLSSQILKSLAESELEDPKILALSNIISEKCILFSKDAISVIEDFQNISENVAKNFISLDLTKIKHAG